MNSDHDYYADWAAAYTLGALDAEDRHAFELHLARCSTCAVEVSVVAPIPGVLARVPPDDRALAPSPGRAAAITEAAHRELGQLQRTAQRWRLAAVAAFAAAAVLVAVISLPTDDTPPTDQLLAMIVSADGAVGSISTAGRLWGTEIRVDLDGLDPRDRYTLWVVDSAQEWSVAAAWGPTPGGRAHVTGASSTQAEDIARMFITSDDRADILVEAAT